MSNKLILTRGILTFLLFFPFQINLLTIQRLQQGLTSTQKYPYYMILNDKTDIIIISMSETLITDYSAYQQEYDSKCNQWRSEPVQNRTCNDVGCVAVFLLILALFVGTGAYYIHEKDVSIVTGNFYIYDRALQIGVCLGIAVVFSLTYVFLIKLMPKIMVYVLIVLSMTLLFGLAVVGFIYNDYAFALTFLIIFLIYGIVLLCLRKQIDMGIILIKIASQFISEKCGVFISPIIKILINVGFGLFWIYSLSSIIAVSDDKVRKGENNNAEQALFYLWFFVWLFFGFVFYYIMVFTIAVACSFWYYKVQGKNFLFTAYKWIFTSSFGSIVFGSILVAIVTFARMLIDARRRQNRNIAAAICLCLVSCCLANIQNLLKILNHNCVIVMSVTGQSYISSAKTTIGILSRFFGLMYVSDIISGLLVFWGIVIVTGIIGIISYLWLDGQGVVGEQLIVLMTVAIVGAVLVSSLVLSVLVQAVSSVFIFYCFDVKFREMGYTSNNMPNEINRALQSFYYQKNQ